MLCRYERTIFKSDKGFCIFSYSTEDQSVPKERATDRSTMTTNPLHCNRLSSRGFQCSGGRAGGHLGELEAWSSVIGLDV